jgi:hypothetical protein
LSIKDPAEKRRIEAEAAEADKKKEAPGMKRPPHDSRRGADRIDHRWRPWRR